MKRSAVLAALAAAACVAPGSASSSTQGASAHNDATVLADRTLVPRRIRLIIDYKRPRLA